MRLIDADAYKKHLASFVVGGEEAIVKNGIGNYWIDGIHTAYREIDNAPTIKTFTLADIEEQYAKGMEKGLEERPHGEWKRTDNRWGVGTWRCTRCNSYYDIDTNYCPTCGARMKEGEAE